MSASGDRFRILDTGGRPRYWEMLPSDLRPKVNISILNLGNEVSNFIDPSNDLRVDYEVGDACDLPHEDNAFDLVHSNSVIEHVGSYERMQRFAEEVRRVGRGYFVQTPSFWFPIEPHYGVPLVHWLPDPMRVCLHTRMRVGFKPRCSFPEALAQVDGTKIITRWQMSRLFRDAEIHNERFAFVTKSLIALRRA